MIWFAIYPHIRTVGATERIDFIVLLSFPRHSRCESKGYSSWTLTIGTLTMRPGCKGNLTMAHCSTVGEIARQKPRGSVNSCLAFEPASPRCIDASGRACRTLPDQTCHICASPAVPASPPVLSEPGESPANTTTGPYGAALAQRHRPHRAGFVAIWAPGTSRCRSSVVRGLR